ncbi:MAG: glycosyltransferase family 2 protein [Acidobacteriota bacterium]
MRQASELAAAHDAPRVVALVLNYNGKQLTLDALDSLAAQRYANLTIVHVDNGSTDDSASAIAIAHPQVRTVRAAENRGPTGGLNLGLLVGLAGDYDYLLSLNNDIEADPDMVAEMVAVAEGDPMIGCVGPKTFYYDHPEVLWSAGGIVRFAEAATRERGMNRRDRGQYERTETVPYINGCAILMRRAAVEAAGPWDPAYEMSAEDADWCMRARRRGYRCVYAHRARLKHRVSATVGVYKPRRTFATGRSAAIFARRYAGPLGWLSFAAAMSAAIPVAYLRERRHGNQAAAVSKLRGVADGLRVALAAPPTVDDLPALVPPWTDLGRGGDDAIRIDPAAATAS